MLVTRHRYGFDVQGHFPGARVLCLWEGGCAYEAERDERPYLILDEGTMADFLLDPEDAGLLDELVTVVEFQDERKRAAYVKEKLGGLLDRYRASQKRAGSPSDNDR